jgi:hypothetical protein
MRFAGDSRQLRTSFRQAVHPQRPAPAARIIRRRIPIGALFDPRHLLLDAADRVTLAKGAGEKTDHSCLGVSVGAATSAVMVTVAATLSLLW